MVLCFTRKASALSELAEYRAIERIFVYFISVYRAITLVSCSGKMLLDIGSLYLNFTVACWLSVLVNRKLALASDSEIASLKVSRMMRIDERKQKTERPFFSSFVFPLATLARLHACDCARLRLATLACLVFPKKS